MRRLHAFVHELEAFTPAREPHDLVAQHVEVLHLTVDAAGAGARRDIEWRAAQKLLDVALGGGVGERVDVRVPQVVQVRHLHRHGCGNVDDDIARAG
eukprot:scaffold109615_cov118-Phaeocystis_antarctica.AAC.1